MNAPALKFPLPAKWSLPERFEEAVQVGGVLVHTCGFAIRHESGVLVTGSAAAIGEAPMARAYFELLERAAIVECDLSGEIAMPLYDLERRQQATCAKSLAFPRSAQPELWVYAKSNGAATQTTWEDACRAAACELVERDVVLRSWYGQLPVERLRDAPLQSAAVFAEHYDVDAYLLGTSTVVGLEGDVKTVAVVAVPRNPAAHPLALGTGAGSTLREAVSKAEQECVQKIGFLWGQPLEDGEVPFTPTAEFHLDYFLRPRHHRLIAEWLAGRVATDRAVAPLPPRRCAFVDLTPTHLRGSIYVVKACCPDTLPLIFGRATMPPFSSAAPDRQIHPIA